MRRLVTLIVAVAAGLATTAIGLRVSADPADPISGGRVAVDIEHSRFEPERLVVRRGSTLEFVIDNGDPIAHEFIIGDDSVHRAHEQGAELEHPPVPGEITVRAGERRSTIFTFDRAGTVVFACHLPGHLAYGMRGEVEVVP